MASATTTKVPQVTETQESKLMATDVIVPGAGQGSDGGGSGSGGSDGPRSPAVTVDGGGFFRIYKRGQGYWTRMITAGGAVLLGLLIADFIYRQVPPQIKWLNDHHGWALGIAAGFFLGFCLLAWKIMNKPANADFLIATDSEMKKVNWTSKKDLIGSTKVVIFFMFLIAFLLFAIDIIFGYVFYWFTILKSPPF